MSLTETPANTSTQLSASLSTPVHTDVHITRSWSQLSWQLFYSGTGSFKTPPLNQFLLLVLRCDHEGLLGIWYVTVCLWHSKECWRRHGWKRVWHIFWVYLMRRIKTHSSCRGGYGQKGRYVSGKTQEDIPSWSCCLFVFNNANINNTFYLNEMLNVKIGDICLSNAFWFWISSSCWDVVDFLQSRKVLFFLQSKA